MCPASSSCHKLVSHGWPNGKKGSDAVRHPPWLPPAHLPHLPYSRPSSTRRGTSASQRRPPSWLSTTHRTVGFGLGPVELLRSCQADTANLLLTCLLIYLVNCTRWLDREAGYSPAKFYPGRPSLRFKVCAWVVVSHTQGDGVAGACGRHATRQILPSFGLGAATAKSRLFQL